MQRPMNWLTGLRLTLLAVVVAVAACTPIVQNHGYTPSDEELAAIAVGRDTRDSVIATYGPPSAEGVVSGGAIYYVSSVWETVGPFKPKEVSREVVAVTFDRGGRVANVTRYGLDHGQVVVLSRRVTTDNVDDRTFIRQLLGNFGRPNVGDFVAN